MSVRLTNIFSTSGLVNQQSGSVYFCLHLSQLKLSVLELTQRLAELFALLDIGNRFIDRSLSNTKSLGGNADPAGINTGHGDLKAFPFFSK